VDLDAIQHTNVVNDALAVYFLDATIASAFVARWCAAQRGEIVDGVYRVRDDEPTSLAGAGPTGIRVVRVLTPFHGPVTTTGTLSF
jgi:hypothetical protein